MEMKIKLVALMVKKNGEEKIAEHYTFGKAVYQIKCDIESIEAYLVNLGLLQDGLFLGNPCRWVGFDAILEKKITKK
jgi:hypothetical protein